MRGPLAEDYPEGRRKSRHDRSSCNEPGGRLAVRTLNRARSTSMTLSDAGWIDTRDQLSASSPSQVRRRSLTISACVTAMTTALSCAMQRAIARTARLRTSSVLSPPGAAACRRCSLKYAHRGSVFRSAKRLPVQHPKSNSSRSLSFVVSTPARRAIAVAVCCARSCGLLSTVWTGIPASALASDSASMTPVAFRLTGLRPQRTSCPASMVACRTSRIVVTTANVP
jgi:hypothetical protein